MKTKSFRKVFVIVMAVVLLIGSVVPSMAASVRGRNTKAIKSGCEVVEVEGVFENPDVTALLKRINAIRYEACTAGNVPDPRNPKRMLTKADYVPVKWSTELEKMAQLRSAEATVLYDHARPNGDADPWTAAYGVRAMAENLCWGNAKNSIEQYYNEKSMWMKVKVFQHDTGHYCNLINPNIKYVALSSFNSSKDGQFSAFVASTQSGLKEGKTGEYGSYRQQIEMSKSRAAKYKKPATVATTGVSLNKTSVSVTEGKTVSLTATVKPSNATDKKVTWTSSNTSIATVSNGTVTAKKAGTVTITVKTANGKTSTCKVTVTAKAKTVAATNVSLNKTSVSVAEGKTVSLAATVAPSNATDKKVTWTSSNTSIATVSNGTVTAKKAGTVTITAKTSNGKTATCKVTVTAQQALKLSATKLNLTPGQEIKLTASNATGSLTYKCSNWSAAYVYSGGKLVAFKPGKCTITVTDANGKTATCNVTVAYKPGENVQVKMDYSTVTIKVGQKVKLNTRLTGVTSTDKLMNHTWSGAGIVTYENGYFIGLKPGTEIITAHTFGGKTATCKIIVIK